jgi:hypothetical protein
MSKRPKFSNSNGSEPVRTDTSPSFWHRYTEKAKSKKALVGASIMAAGALTTSGYVISHAEAPDFKSVNITQIGGDFIDYGEETAPVLLGAAVLQLLLVAGGSFKGNLRFAWEGLETQNPNPYRKAVRGAVLPAVAITALSTAFMINDGLRTGPDHNIEAMVASIESAAGSKAAGKEVVLGLSPGTYL